MAESESSSDYEHWPDDDASYSDEDEAISMSGYDEFNGLRRFDYLPSNGAQEQKPPKKEASPAPEPQHAQPAPAALAYATPAPPAYAQQVPFVPNPYAYPTAIGYPMPAFIGFPAPAGAAPGFTPFVHPTAVPPAVEEKKEKKEKKAKKPDVKKWQGRTKVEVE